MYIFNAGYPIPFLYGTQLWNLLELIFSPIYEQTNKQTHGV
jgi:hypothetical protein